jgi:hypothetical protein
MQNVRLIRAVTCATALLASITLSTVQANSSVTPEEARAIAKEAYTYGNPLVDSYRILYSYFVDEKDSDFKAPWNQIKNIPPAATVQVGSPAVRSHSCEGT